MKTARKTTGGKLQWTLALLFGLAGPAQATLVDNGDGTITDTSTGLMWLQDANLAKTSGYDADGRMNWNDAMEWVGNLVFAGYDDWRLPSLKDIGNDGCNFAYSGTDCGHNTDTSVSEMAYMFHDILGNTSWYDPEGDEPHDGAAYDGSCTITAPWCLQNTSADGVDILNLQAAGYWLGTESYSATAWFFDTQYGYQNHAYKYHNLYAWAVRSAQSSVVPLPAAFWLFGSGLVGLVAVARRQAR